MAITWTLYCIAAILQRICLVIVPAMALYGVTRIMARGDVDATIAAPFFGVGRLSPKFGALVWTVCLIMLGSIFRDAYLWHSTGVSPLLPLS